MKGLVMERFVGEEEFVEDAGLDWEGENPSINVLHVLEMDQGRTYSIAEVQTGGDEGVSKSFCYRVTEGGP